MRKIGALMIFRLMSILASSGNFKFIYLNFSGKIGITREIQKRYDDFISSRIMFNFARKMGY